MEREIYTLIIPHYNIPKLLRRLLSTVPHREDLQVIVVDDCSTKELDELEKVRQDYDWVEWYTTGTNGGGGKARNIGLDHAQGKYLIFADADDYFTSDIIPLLNYVLPLYSDFDLLFFPVLSKDIDTQQISNRHLNKVKAFEEFKNRPKAFENWMRFCYTEPWGKIIRLKLIKDNHIRFQESLVANDFLFSVKLGYCAKKVKFIPEYVFYIYSVHAGSISINQFESKVKIMSRLSVYYDVEQFAKEHNIGIYPYSRFFAAIYLKHRKQRKSLKEFCNVKGMSYTENFVTSWYNTMKFSIIHKIFKVDVI